MARKKKRTHKRSPEQKKKFINAMGNHGFQYMGSKLEDCGKVAFGLQALYNIGQTNKMAGAYIDKISDMVGGEGFELIETKPDGVKEVVEVPEVMGRAKSFFRHGYADNITFKQFVRAAFVQIFSSGEISLVPNKINLFNRAPKDGHIKVLDTRGLMKNIDNFGNVNSYHYMTMVDRMEKLTPKQVCNIIPYPDVNYPLKGYSKFNRIILEALTNIEANRRQLYFFKNQAVPNILVMMDNDKIDSHEDIEAFGKMWNQKYRGTSNSNKPLISDIVTDVKTLELSNTEMDYINMRKENDKDFAVVFCLDYRLIGGIKETGSFGEVESVTIRQGNQQIESYGDTVADIMTMCYKKFVDPKFEYEFRMKNKMFRDINGDKEISLKEIAAGIKNGNEHREEFGMQTFDIDELNSYKKQGPDNSKLSKEDKDDDGDSS